MSKNIVVPINDPSITKKFSRSGGKGGQNVNKVNTKVRMHLLVSFCCTAPKPVEITSKAVFLLFEVELRVALKNNSWLPADVVDRICKAEPGRINNEHELIIKSTNSRSQVNLIHLCICHAHHPMASWIQPHSPLLIAPFKAGNIKDCYAKLQRVVDAAAVAPKERKMREVVRFVNTQVRLKPSSPFFYFFIFLCYWIRG